MNTDNSQRFRLTLNLHGIAVERSQRFQMVDDEQTIFLGFVTDGIAPEIQDQ